MLTTQQCSSPRKSCTNGLEQGSGGPGESELNSHCSHLDPGRNVVDDADGLGVGVARQAVGDDMELHLPWGLSAGFLPIDDFACGTLEAAVLLWKKLVKCIAG